jgi:DNA polymerase I-like protein with 3'-5' exonuclease and polymerase domains
MGTGLADAMAAYGLDFLSHMEKEEERGYIRFNTSYPPDGQRRILDYCWTDVDGTAQLWEKMLPDLDLEQALHRGAYAKAVAWMEHNGLPISPLYHQVTEHRRELQLRIAQGIEAKHGYGVFTIEGKKSPRPVFTKRGFGALIRRLGLEDVWPLTPKGSFQTDDEKAFEPMAKLHPELEPLRQARKSVASLGRFGSAIGTDGRNRAAIMPFGTVTGRNNPKALEFILSRSHWVRHLIAPEAGRALVYADIVAAEAGIAADASGDPEFLRIYNSGLDPYIEFAKSARVLPGDAVREKKKRPDIEQIRRRYKVADFAIKYGVGGQTLATNLGVPLWEADRIIASHKRTYRTYWAWAEAQVEHAYQAGYISTSFGWTMAVDRSTGRNTVLNFPQQAACAELLRLTLVLAVERGLGPMLCAPHHDAFYLECAEEDADNVSSTLEACFQDACGVVLSGHVLLRLEAGIVRHPYHYEDEDGKEIWEIVEDFLAGRTADGSAKAASQLKPPTSWETTRAA